jgi:hypothetical protein
MGIEQLTKDELTKMLEEKETTLELLNEKKEQKQASYMTSDLVRALENGRCRSCVGRIYEMMRPIPGDPEGRTKKVTMQEGHPYKGGKEIACRTCNPVRHALRGAGVQGIRI